MVSTKTNFRLDLLCNPDYNKSYTNKLLRLIDKLRINSYVSILYKSNNVFEHLKQSHFVLLTSISKCGGPETFGRTIIEGWDACCVIISTNCGGPVELIKDGENGFLFEEKNYHALSQIIERVANDDVLFQKIRAQGKKSSTNFSMRNICDSLEKILTIK
jgi:glycosyltransferase involved in cell wall biosynthesis